MPKKLGTMIFPRLAESPVFKRKPWTISPEAMRKIEEIERNAREAPYRLQNFLLD